MPGGLLNLVATGNQNVILNGNPTKTFFKYVYAKYTNFGLQKFRLDYSGSRTLNVSEDSHFTFKVPRYGDLVLDTCLVFTLPHIWSPIYPPKPCDVGVNCPNRYTDWSPYEFKWIENIGTQIIKEVTITCGGLTLQKFSGNYLTTLAQRDFTNTERDLLDEMTGNIPSLYDPGNSGANVNSYPNAFFDNSPANAEPSIRGRKLYIPISAWYSFSSKMAIPLIALQYNELNINITLRPIKELFKIRDVNDLENNYPHIQPNFSNTHHLPYNFIQPPPNEELDYQKGQMINTWNADIHIMSTYAFLSQDENKVFASKDQKYLIKDIREYTFNNVVGTEKVSIPSLGMVSSWMFFFRRTDASLRNEWSNYTNWAYNNIIPQPPQKFQKLNHDNTPPGLIITGPYNAANQKLILQNLGILCDGKYRENLLDAGVYNYMEKYNTIGGKGAEGLYCYNFALKTSPFDLQPSGAMNMSKFKDIEFEFTTFIPTRDPNAQALTICGDDGEIIAVNKPTWMIYEYTYDMHILEESYNILTFTSGNCGLMFAK
tara:strand:+ start:564 stop:2192 length:1629 start_codon:yes stop_codon:yes gene_type:complete